MSIAPAVPGWEDLLDKPHLGMVFSVKTFSDYDNEVVCLEDGYSTYSQIATCKYREFADRIADLLNRYGLYEQST